MISRAHEGVWGEQSQHVLILEPNAPARAAVFDVVESLDLSPMACNDPEECADQLAQESAVCIVATIDSVTQTFPGLLDLVDDHIYAAPIVLTTPTELEASNERLLRRGVWDLLTKPIDTIRTKPVLAKAASEGRRRLGDRRFVFDFQRCMAELSHDEQLVLEAVCDGKLNKQIARELNVSIRTIEQRRRRVFQKMNVDSAIPLARRLATARTLERLHAPRRRAATTGIAPIINGPHHQPAELV